MKVSIFFFFLAIIKFFYEDTENELQQSRKQKEPSTKHNINGKRKKCIFLVFSNIYKNIIEGFGDKDKFCEEMVY